MNRANILLVQFFSACALSLACMFPAKAQYSHIWVDIGELKAKYSEVGGVWVNNSQDNMQWPAIMRNSGSSREDRFWLGVKDWTSPDGQFVPYAIARSSLFPNTEGSIIPVSRKLYSKRPQTETTINGLRVLPFPGSTDHPPVNVDPALPADQMAHHVYRTFQGVEVDQKVYAFAHEYHDDYHLNVRTFTNTGNVDGDDDIELPNQTIQGMMVYNIRNWIGRVQAGDASTLAQKWGKFNMIDVVGDGNATYPVDFTAIYSWAGYDPNFREWNNLGSPKINPHFSYSPRDTTGSLAGLSMQGLVVLHADNSASDKTYNPDMQPRTLGFVDSDNILTIGSGSAQDLYEMGILTPENPAIVPGGSSRMFPHYADRVEPSGAFWNPVNDAANGTQGGHASTVAYGPYDLAPGESITIVEAIASNGLSFEAAKVVGEAYKSSGFNDDLIITYDANRDGRIDFTPFDYATFDNGTEAQTKNQWFLSSRDSLFKSMYLARNAWEASDNMTHYPFLEPPTPPQSFEVNAFGNRIELRWSTYPGTPNPVSWEIYRTRIDADNLPYERIATLAGSVRSYTDFDLILGLEYYYYLQAVGPANNVDPNSIAGTPFGEPLRSSKYPAITSLPAYLIEPAEIPPYVQFLNATNGERGDDFGNSGLSVHGNYVAVGARPFVSSTRESLIYMYERQSNRSWLPTDLLTDESIPENALESPTTLGTQMLIAGDRLFTTGAIELGDNDSQGVVHVFDRQSDKRWLYTTTIRTDNRTDFDAFGSPLFFEDDLLFISASRDNDGQGAVYVFEEQPDGTWAEQAKLTAEDPNEASRFGRDITYSNGHLFISSFVPLESNNNIGSGLIYVFEKQSGNSWVQTSKIESPTGEPTGEFGREITSTGNQVLINIPFISTGSFYASGEVYVYEKENGTWERQQSLRAIKPLDTRFGSFGFNLTASNNRFIAWGPGGVVVFQRFSEGRWFEVETLQELDSYVSDYQLFANRMTLHGDIALVGSLGLSGITQSTVYVFDLGLIKSTSIEGDASLASPETFVLEQNYPNPFNPATIINFDVPTYSRVRLVVYDVLGKKVKTLLDEERAPGRHSVRFDATGLTSGAYFYRLETPDTRITKSMLLVR